MTEEGDGEETEKESKERDGDVEEDGEEVGGDRKLGRVMDLPRVKYWDDRRVTIYISGKKGVNLKDNLTFWRENIFGKLLLFHGNQLISMGHLLQNCWQKVSL